jgi:hypothetical protein
MPILLCTFFEPPEIKERMAKELIGVEPCLLHINLDEHESNEINLRGWHYFVKYVRGSDREL